MTCFCGTETMIVVLLLVVSGCLPIRPVTIDAEYKRLRSRQRQPGYVLNDEDRAIMQAWTWQAQYTIERLSYLRMINAHAADNLREFNLSKSLPEDLGLAKGTNVWGNPVWEFQRNLNEGEILELFKARVKAGGAK